MLLVHQAGSVKVGEIVRYTLTYTPSHDRILPTPQHLHVKIKNTSAIPLRAAWLRGPYVLHVAAYPETFNPHKKVEEPDRYGTPEYEPMLKAGGSWQTKLTVPEDIRETGADLGKRSISSEHDKEDEKDNTMTWIIEVTSQILFSNSASVHYEVLIGRDERSLDLGFAAVAGHGHGAPGQIRDQSSEPQRKKARRKDNVMTAGVYSKAVRLVAEDVATLWDKPALPTWDDQPAASQEKARPAPKKKRKNIHLVVVTHGLHSNVGADMLFLKESIDATVAQARLDAKARKAAARKQADERKVAGKASEVSTSEDTTEETATAPLSGGQEELNGADEDEDEEETIVRGFTGNAIRTENGIQYLGKRLAKYVLRFTYPDQPFLPVMKPLSKTLTDPFRADADKARRDGQPSHSGSSIHHPSHSQKAEDLPYKFTSISFVGHSLGGLIQTYAVAYIQKHSPTFFEQIQPVNFIAMASPMLGLSNENPLYVKFALDFGLVGRTGQDLGLSWRPNTLARGGWNAVIGGLGVGAKDEKDKQAEDPAAKPLLRILPTGPAHQVLRMFRNRTVYSNVVNDGIVPLRTSCLLFLDWRGLGKVEKARRENGLIGTMAEWGWAELTGANAGTIRRNVLPQQFGDDEDDDDEHVRAGDGDAVPLPAEDETEEDNRRLSHRVSHDDEMAGTPSTKSANGSVSSKTPANDKGMFESFFDFFKSAPSDAAKLPAQMSKKTRKTLSRAQTMRAGEDELPAGIAAGAEGMTDNPMMRPHMTRHQTGDAGSHKRPPATRGDSLRDSETGELQAPPKTSIFESAGDILHPPMPSKQWITDPTSRSRTIFHDRVYHPEDIPSAPVKRPGSRLTRSFSSDSGAKTLSSGTHPSTLSLTSQDSGSVDTGAMKVEEKIARAYHKDLSWRKVLVRLEPDAHNNIIVRRMFANAYGWPVVKHLCDTHFGDTYSARTRDEDEPARERAEPLDKPLGKEGEQVVDQTSKRAPERSRSEMREARDELVGLDVSKQGIEGGNSAGPRGREARREDSAASVAWDDSFFGDEDGDDDTSDVDERTLVQRLINPNTKTPKAPAPAHLSQSSDKRDVSITSSQGTLPVSAYTEGHRGLAPTSPTTPSASSKKAGKTASFGAGSPLVADHLEAEPQALGESSPGSAAVPGLRKSAEEQIGSMSQARRQ
ncbi:hypothetical protein LTR62_007679 [Meristemomyces frigidus]|uniref:DUF676 domain-containing protein n=1 Tax=Meristemomyces frigidus TaxID=1508187 RepID=A0AAN7TIQ8_9PEZI|nr:hypothetical protein LTR62_007679 [Meristemomyces frigidus]